MRFLGGGQDNENKVIIEFCDTSDANGIFRKYSAYIVGERIIPQHIMVGRDWMLKGVESLADKESELLEEQNYLKNNPHKHQLREILQLQTPYCLKMKLINSLVFRGKG